MRENILEKIENGKISKLDFMEKMYISSDQELVDIILGRFKEGIYKLEDVEFLSEFIFAKKDLFLLAMDQFKITSPEEFYALLYNSKAILDYVDSNSELDYDLITEVEKLKLENRSELESRLLKCEDILSDIDDKELIDFLVYNQLYQYARFIVVESSAITKDIQEYIICGIERYGSTWGSIRSYNDAIKKYVVENCFTNLSMSVSNADNEDDLEYILGLVKDGIINPSEIVYNSFGLKLKNRKEFIIASFRDSSYYYYYDESL